MKAYSGWKPFLVFVISAVLLACCGSFLSDDDDSSDEGTAYTVTYDANGATSGSVPADSKTYAKGASVTVLGNSGSLAKTGCDFQGWNTKADGTGTTYAAGQTFTMGNASLTLYAKWTGMPGYALWARSALSGSDETYFEGAAADSSGNVYAAGYQYGALPYTYGTGVTAVNSTYAGYNSVIVKYDPVGTALWAKTFSSSSDDSMFNAVCVDSAGGVVAAGYQNKNGAFAYDTGAAAAGASSDFRNVSIARFWQ